MNVRLNAMGPAQKNLDLFLQWGHEGDVIVFLHYFGGGAASWRWTSMCLQGEYQCLAFNLLGFGGTPAIHKLSIQHYARAIQAQLKHLHIHAYHLVGHSMGGKIALQVAANQAPGLKTVTLVAPSPPTYEPMPDSEKRRLLNDSDRQTATQTITDATIQPISSVQRELAIQTHMEMSHSVRRWWLLKGMNESIAAQMKQIRVPVTALLSMDDPVISYDKIRPELAELIPDIQLITTHRVGHLMPFESPKLIANTIKESIGKQTTDCFAA